VGLGADGGASIRSSNSLLGGRENEDVVPMDPAILPATAALFGSLVGGVSTLAASWLTERGQLWAQTLVHEAVERETL
jgi:hypothetical protein